MEKDGKVIIKTLDGRLIVQEDRAKGQVSVSNNPVANRCTVCCSTWELYVADPLGALHDNLLGLNESQHQCCLEKCRYMRPACAWHE